MNFHRSPNTATRKAIWTIQTSSPRPPTLFTFHLSPFPPVSNSSPSLALSLPHSPTLSLSSIPTSPATGGGGLRELGRNPVGNHAAAVSCRRRSSVASKPCFDAATTPLGERGSVSRQVSRHSALRFATEGREGGAMWRPLRGASKVSRMGEI